METVLLGLAGTATLGVAAWIAKAAIKEPRIFVALRPSMIVTCAITAMFGGGLLVGSMDPHPKLGLWLAAGGLIGILFLIGLNSIAKELHGSRQQPDRQANTDTNNENL